MGTANAAIGTQGAAAQNVIVRGLRNGLVASVPFAMVMMVLGIFDQGFFAAPSSIWAFWAGPSAYHPRDFDVGFVIGAIGHMMNSAVLGIVFGALASRVLKLGGTGASVVSGVVFALVVMAILWFVILPLAPNGQIVKDSSAGWIWILGHVAFGVTGGWLYSAWR